MEPLKERFEGNEIIDIGENDFLPEKKKEDFKEDDMMMDVDSTFTEEKNTENQNPEVANSNSLFKLFDPLNSSSFESKSHGENLSPSTLLLEGLNCENKLQKVEEENYSIVINGQQHKLIDIETPQKGNEQSSVNDNPTSECIINISNKSEQLNFDVEETQTEELDVEKHSANENIKQFAVELLNSVIEKAVIIAEYRDPTYIDLITIKKTMADINDKLEEENAELKLQLNASQQVRATLELQLRQKEEIIIKSQTESSRKDQAYKLEVKQLKEKLEEKCIENDNTQPTKELQETIKGLKARESKLLSELNAKKNEEQNYGRIMDDYEKTMVGKVSELQKLQEEHETVKQHLANLELAFSDVHQKYERSKKIIDGYKCNEEALRQTLMSSEDNAIKSEEKYESLKAHAKAQIEKSNQEMQLMRDQYESEIHKLSAIIRRLEIKNASLADSLDQKIKECSALAALCDEVTGKV